MTATACIKRRDYTWCGRQPEVNEFLFEHAPHAIKHYEKNAPIIVCEHCRKKAIEEGVLENEPSMANRENSHGG